jgi:hypothetical protein
MAPSKTFGLFLDEHGGRHRRNRDDKRNCEDKSDEPPAQYTPSVNRTIVT